MLALSVTNFGQRAPAVVQERVQERRVHGRVHGRLDGALDGDPDPVAAVRDLGALIVGSTVACLYLNPPRFRARFSLRQTCRFRPFGNHLFLILLAGSKIRENL
ncbi:hypothetical protein ACRBEV_12250 [Methylobacterium phyllosphaerae]